MTAAVSADRQQARLCAEVEGRFEDYLADELNLGSGPFGVEMLPSDEPDGPLLVRYRGQRYAIEVEIRAYATAVPDPLTSEQEAEQRAREIQTALEASMVPLFDASLGAS